MRFNLTLLATVAFATSVLSQMVSSPVSGLSPENIPQSANMADVIDPTSPFVSLDQALKQVLKDCTSLQTSFDKAQNKGNWGRTDVLPVEKDLVDLGVTLTIIANGLKTRTLPTKRFEVALGLLVKISDVVVPLAANVAEMEVSSEMKVKIRVTMN
jgi:hypothetical protein